MALGARLWPGSGWSRGGVTVALCLGATCVLAGVAVALLATAASIAARIGADPVTLALRLGVETRAGQLRLILAGLGLMAAVALAAHLAGLRGGRGWLAAGTGSVAGVILVGALAGHAGAAQGGTGAVALHCCHLAFGAGWAALVALLALPQHPPERLARGLVRASPFALVAAGVIAVSGVALAGWHGLRPATLGEPYGLLVVVKLAAFLAALMPAAWNRWSGLPGLLAGTTGPAPVRRALRLELAAIAVLLAAAAALTETAPPHG